MKERGERMNKEQEILQLEGVIIIIMFLTLILLGLYFHKQDFLKDCIWAFPIIGVGCISALFLLSRRDRLLKRGELKCMENAK